MKNKIHFSQVFNIQKEEENFDFFDLNLKYDSPLFIDPFLIKNSRVEEEKRLFQRFGDFFRFAYDNSLETDEEQLKLLKNILNIHEPKEIGLGFTERSHEGAGPGLDFANILLSFFINSSAKRLIKEDSLFPNGEFNPVTLEIFTDGLGPDGLSDITANIVMDYLIDYTQKQCKKLSIPLKSLPLETDGFNFDEMEWRGGGYYDLPENPFNEGHAFILVPKRFLRARIDDKKIGSKIKGLLSEDSQLKIKFSGFLHKNINEINIKDIRQVFLEENSVFKKYFEILTTERTKAYNFSKDILGILSSIKFDNFFEEKIINNQLNNCKDLLDRTFDLINIFKDHCMGDGWKDMWIKEKPKREPDIGRFLRGMGNAYFANFPEVTFEHEVGTGNGPVDFKIIYKDCRIVIELKKLMNGSPKGKPPLPSYMHGIERQLPNYAYNTKANHAIYITGQHYTSINRPRDNNNERFSEINDIVPAVEEKMKKLRRQFQSLHYINIDMSPKRSASNL